MSTRMFAMCVSLMGLMAGPALASSMWWQPYTTDANTIGLWHFDDVTGSTGTFADSTVNGNTGTLNANAGGNAGLTLTVPAVSGAGMGPGAGLFGTALDYDETKDPLPGVATSTPFAWGSVPNSGGALDYGNAVTLEAWIKPTAGDLAPSPSGREAYIAGSSIGAAGFNFGIYQGELFVDTRDTSSVYRYAQQSGVTLVADTWAHVAAVLSNDGTNSTATVYVNGSSVATSSWADTALGPASSILNIGANGTSAQYVMLRSQLDEVRLSNVARTFGPVVPEPASLALLAVGSLSLMALRRRRA